MVLNLWNAVEKIGERDWLFNAKDVISTVLKSGKASGYTLGDMRAANKLLDKLESDETAATNQVELTAEEQGLLSATMEAFRFAILSENIVKLGDMLAVKIE